MSGSDDQQRDVDITAGSSNVEGRQLDAMYRTEAPRLARFLRRRVSGADDPSDFVQEAFLRLVGSTPEAPLRNPEAYLQRIVRNLLVDRSRHRARTVQMSLSRISTFLFLQLNPTRSRRTT